VGLVVTGISQSQDVSALEAALRNAGFSLEPLQVISGGGEPEALSHFQANASNGIGRDRIMLSNGGTGVPGLTGPSSSGRPHFRTEASPDRLGDLEIPDSQIDNYLDALDAGRSVVAYFAKPTTLTQLEDIFRGAGLAVVRTF
jgi:hypothetical protein